jgi:hypothetical protein
VSEEVPGEPRRGASPVGVALRLPFYAAWTTLVWLLTLGLWPIYWIGHLVWGRAPNVLRIRQTFRYLKLIWTVSPPPPGLPITSRLWLTIRVLRKTATVPFWSLFWYLDELLYGRELRREKVEAPLFEMSAGRSGSTQLARYLEADPGLVAPSFLQTVFPYIWLWRLAAATLGRVVTKEWVREKLAATLPTEFVQRHEVDPFAMDTFEIALFMGHLSTMAPLLGPDVALDDFCMAETSASSEKFWTEDLPDMIDRLGRKLLVQAHEEGRGDVRVFVKGHFLAAADALEERFPDACFLTVVRDPAARFRSAINYLRANVLDPVLEPVPWAWLAETVATSETRYCDIEMEWYQRPGPCRRCVVRFADFTDDLAGTMERVYRECLDSEVPESIPREHAPRERTNYLVNRTLDELGYDVDALNERCAEYIQWAG